MKASPLLPVDTWLDELARQVERLATHCDPDAVHRLRVAAGRLSVWLELGARRALRDDLRRLRRAAAAVRDLDVISGSDGSAGWAEILRSERAEGALTLRAAIASPRVGDLIDALALVPEPDPVCVRAALQRLKRRTLRAGENVDAEEGAGHAHHRLRRRVRRLRYALEWLGAESDEIRALQESLGTLNDLSIELERLEQLAANPALSARHAAVEREIELQRAQALERWRELRPRIGDL